MPRIRLLALIVALTVSGVATIGYLLTDTADQPRSTSTPTPAVVSASPSPTLTSSSTPRGPTPAIPAGVWASWALLDGKTQTVTAGGQRGTSTTESMIKVAIGAGYLLRVEKAGRTPTARERQLLSQMIQVSDNDAAETLYHNGGGDTMLRGVATRCGLRETTTKHGWWSETKTTAADAARLGQCVAEGRVCSPAWAAWLLGEMRQVHGASRFGFVDVRPTDRGRPLAIKNGYTLRDFDGLWHVNCLAVADWWSAAVMMRYPGSLGLGYGARLCRSIAAAIMPADDVAGPSPSS